MTAPARSRSIRIRGSSSRIYTDATGREYPSVTSVIGLLDKSDALVPWAAKAAAEYAVLHRDALAQLPAPDAITLIKNNWRQKRDQAADLGTLVHDYLDRGRRPDRLPERAYFEQAERFIEEIGLTVEATEVSVCNPEIGYAGTLDVLATQGGDRIIADWKTGKGLYESHALQLVALGEATHILSETGELAPFDPVDRGIAVRIGTDDYEWRVINRGTAEWVAAWDAFRGLIPVWEWKREIKEVWSE